MAPVDENQHIEVDEVRFLFISFLFFFFPLFVRPVVRLQRDNLQCSTLAVESRVGLTESCCTTRPQRWRTRPTRKTTSMYIFPSIYIYIYVYLYICEIKADCRRAGRRCQPRCRPAFSHTAWRTAGDIMHTRPAVSVPLFIIFDRNPCIQC